MKRRVAPDPELFADCPAAPSPEAGRSSVWPAADPRLPREFPSASSRPCVSETADFPVAGASFPAEALGAFFERLSRSAFRSRFRLRTTELDYIAAKGLATIRQHAGDFVRQRLAPAFPPNDGRQTPMRGHPVFVAQHATGCCCRGCLAKWHGIPAGRPLTAAEQAYVVEVLMAWIGRQMAR